MNLLSGANLLRARVGGVRGGERVRCERLRFRARRAARSLIEQVVARIVPRRTLSCAFRQRAKHTILRLALRVRCLWPVCIASTNEASESERGSAPRRRQYICIHIANKWLSVGAPVGPAAPDRALSLVFGLICGATRVARDGRSDLQTDRYIAENNGPSELMGA